MLRSSQAHQDFEITLLHRIAQSERFQVYQEAFRMATGLPLRIVTADPEGW